jgi:tryptophan-rich sensory protein
MMGRQVLGLAVAVLACLAAGAAGSIATADAIPTWYATLQKPAFNPPGWVFGPVWTTLYVMMGVAVWLVWREAGWAGARVALVLFAIQLVLNTAWSFLFFGLRSPLFGFIDIILLWVMIVATIGAFYRVKKSAAYLLIPYIAWVSIATCLNYAIWVLNP